MEQIPKILHQIWYQGFDQLPPRYKPWFQQWGELHPDWNHHCWDEQQIRSLIKEQYPGYLDLFDSYKKRIQRIDLARIFILHHYGGVYADMDTQPLKPLDSLVLGNGTQLFFDNICPEKPFPLQLQALLYSNGSLRKGPIINNDFMGSTTGHPFWKEVMTHLKPDSPAPVGRPEILHILNATGPLFLSKILRAGRWIKDSGTKLIDPELVSPGMMKRSRAKWLGGDPDQVKVDLSKAYLLHHGDNSWMPDKRKFIGKYMVIVSIALIALILTIRVLKR